MELGYNLRFYLTPHRGSGQLGEKMVQRNRGIMVTTDRPPGHHARPVVTCQNRVVIMKDDPRKLHVI